MNTKAKMSTDDKLEEVITLLKSNQLAVKEGVPMKIEKDDTFPSEQDKEFIENSVDLVLTKLCPDYPVKERSGYFELGNFFILIQLHNSKNQLQVGMKTEHNMRKELLELSFVFTQTGSFEITDFPSHEINNLVFKFFIDLRREIERRRLLKARSSKLQRFFAKWIQRLSVKDSWEL